MKGPLKPLGGLYGRVMNARNAMYDRGSFRAHSLGARTISVGNITTGGTGKTPVVALVAEMLADAGEVPCILTRGYGRRDPGKRVLVSNGTEVLATASEGGDEPVELAEKLRGKAAVIADADRVGAAEWARAMLGVTAFILDDGFQHRRASRDLDIVCVDATDPFGGGELLPAGRLREPIEGLGRADAIILTRSDLAESDGAESRIREAAHGVPVFKAQTRLRRFSGCSGEGVREPGRSYVFCAIGNPTAFETQLRNEGLEIAGFRPYRDHHRYTQRDVDVLVQEARSLAADNLVTTAKDAVKLEGLQIPLPCLVAEADVEIDDAAAFRKMILG